MRLRTCHNPPIHDQKSSSRASTQLFSAVNCWLKCMLLEPYNQTDHPECKSRPDSGLSAITELDPGYITAGSVRVNGPVTDSRYPAHQQIPQAYGYRQMPARLDSTNPSQAMGGYTLQSQKETLFEELPF
ncbi:Phospholipid--sterol O-acyltransferase [Zea mays]|uniref:Phospholipid--sterol O-acyltransferase n=1 Tax=Zea mays TaxID=4577 RepID=A0A3L6FS08_MAIZE|nr:Phospholipid--sterol O-acyltransferase [Zea mays]